MTTEEARNSDITKLLADVANGDDRAKSVLIETIYGELRHIAASLMRGERKDHTLNSTALVNEALLRLIKPQQLSTLVNRRMLFSAAARAMRQVLIDSARGKENERKLTRLPLVDVEQTAESLGIDLEAFSPAMADLELSNPRAFQALDLRFFAGLKVAEIATLLEISKSSIEKDLKEARSFLRGRLMT